MPIVSVGGSRAIPLPRINSGGFLDSSYAYGGARSTLALAADTLYGIPLGVDKPVRVDQAAFEVTVASIAATNAQIGLMVLDPNVAWMGKLIADIGPILTDTIGIKTAPFAYTFIPGFVYLPVIVPQAAVTVASLNITRHVFGTTSVADTNPGRSGLTKAAHGYGALPPSAVFLATTGLPPRIAFRVV